MKKIRYCIYIVLFIFEFFLAQCSIIRTGNNTYHVLEEKFFEKNDIVETIFHKNKWRLSKHDRYADDYTDFHIFLKGNFEKYETIKLEKVVFRLKNEEKIINLNVNLIENSEYELETSTMFSLYNKKNDCRVYIIYFFILNDNEAAAVYHIFDFYKIYGAPIEFWMPSI
jgi:hypothetical protein